METLSPDEIITVRIAGITDRRGQPAEIDGTPDWRAEPDDALVLTVLDEGMAVEIVAADNHEGDVATVLCDIDADLGEDVELITGVLTLAITGGRARFIDLAVSERRARDTEPPGP